MKSPLLSIAVLACAGLLTLTPTTAHARADTPPAAQANAQADAKPLDVSDLVAKIRTASGVPALGVAVVRNGQLWAIGADGNRTSDPANTVPVTIDDQWHIGSCTKAFTATLCAILVERGTLRWDMTVAEALPELVKSGTMHKAWHTATLWQLCSNRAGAPAGLEKGGLWGNLWKSWKDGDSPRTSRAMLAAGMLARPPASTPGTKDTYSNAGFALAGHIAETVTNIDYEILLAREIFEPLGMTHTGFGPPGIPPAVKPGDTDAPASPLQPWGHRRKAGAGNAKPTYTPVKPGYGADNPPAIAPAGTIHSTLADWSRFIAIHAMGEQRGWTDADGKVRLSAASFKKLHSPPEDDLAKSAYGFGWVTTKRPWGKGELPTDTGRVITHNGSNTMWYSVAWVAPETGYAVIATSNAAGPESSEACDDACAAMTKLSTAPRAGPDQKTGPQPDSNPEPKPAPQPAK